MLWRLRANPIGVEWALNRAARSATLHKHFLHPPSVPIESAYVLLCSARQPWAALLCCHCLRSAYGTAWQQRCSDRQQESLAAQRPPCYLSIPSQVHPETPQILDLPWLCTGPWLPLYPQFVDRTVEPRNQIVPLHTHVRPARVNQGIMTRPTRLSLRLSLRRCVLAYSSHAHALESPHPSANCIVHCIFALRRLDRLGALAHC